MRNIIEGSPAQFYNVLGATIAPPAPRWRVGRISRISVEMEKLGEVEVER